MYGALVKLLLLFFSFVSVFVLARPADIVDHVQHSDTPTSVVVSGGTYDWRAFNSFLFSLAVVLDSPTSVSLLVNRCSIRGKLQITGVLGAGSTIEVSGTYTSTLSSDTSIESGSIFRIHNTVVSLPSVVEVIISDGSQLWLEYINAASITLKTTTRGCSAQRSCLLVVQHSTFESQAAMDIPLSIVGHSVGGNVKGDGTYFLVYNNSVDWIRRPVDSPSPSLSISGFTGAGSVLSILLNTFCPFVDLSGYSGSIEYWANVGRCSASSSPEILLGSVSPILIFSNIGVNPIKVAGSPAVGTPRRRTACSNISSPPALNIQSIACDGNTMLSRCTEALSVYSPDTPKYDFLTSTDVTGCVLGTEWSDPGPPPQTTSLPQTTTTTQNPTATTFIPSYSLPTTTTKPTLVTTQPEPSTPITSQVSTTSATSSSSTATPILTTDGTTTLMPTDEPTRSTHVSSTTLPPTPSNSTAPMPPISSSATPTHATQFTTSAPASAVWTAQNVVRQVAGASAILALLTSDSILVIQFFIYASVLELSSGEDTSWNSGQYSVVDNVFHIGLGNAPGAFVRGGLLSAGVVVLCSLFGLVTFSFIRWRRLNQSDNENVAFSFHQFPSGLFPPLCFSALVVLHSSAKLLSFSDRGADIGIGSIIVVVVFLYCAHVLSIVTVWLPGTVRFLPVPIYVHGTKRHFQLGFATGGVWVAVQFGGGSSQCLPSMGDDNINSKEMNLLSPESGDPTQVEELDIVDDSESSSVIWLSRFKGYIRMTHAHQWFVGYQLVTACVLQILASVGLRHSSQARNVIALLIMMANLVLLAIFRPYASRALLASTALGSLLATIALGFNASNSSSLASAPMLATSVLCSVSIVISILCFVGSRLARLKMFGGGSRAPPEPKEDKPVTKRRRLTHTALHKQRVRMLDA